MKHLGERASIFTNLEGIGYVPWGSAAPYIDLIHDNIVIVEAEMRKLGFKHISSWPMASFNDFEDVLQIMIDEGWHVGKFTHALVWDDRTDPGVPTTLWGFSDLSAATRLSLNFDSRGLSQ